MRGKLANNLIKESSLYLLQHARNPVDWHPWKKEVLQLAREENKLLLISIGYSACHWCHIMEKESFEDKEVAILMNTNFINIKVDREERPDIDHIYMNAVQLMTGSGGWPLNVVALPDGSPIWGGTYFKPQQWIHTLNQLVELHKTKPNTLREYATQLREGIIHNNTIIPKEVKPPIHLKEIAKAVESWAVYFDEEYGGTKRTPKFMMPVNIEFLLYYGMYAQDKKILKYVETTLTKMAYGGIYDHVGGGFSRYAVDEKWHIPHFEKMLYDNAQLVSLYSNAYRATKNKKYKNIVEKTLFCIQQEFANAYGAFYSSLDADSDNEAGIQEEGSFYVWKKKELQELLKEDFSVFADYYNINSFGLWEGENYILIQNASEEEIAKKTHCTIQELRARIHNSIRILLQARNQRNRPRSDDKTLTSWNALMLKAYIDAYKAFGDKTYFNIAIKNARFLLKYQHKKDGGLYHSFKDGKSSIDGFLEDYATVCEAFITLYEASGDQKWLTHAKALTHYCYDNFYDEKSGFFFFTHIHDPVIVTKTIERADNVIPASNSIMAKVLFKLSRYFHNNRYAETAQNMLYALKEDILLYPYSHANWLSLAMHFCANFYEVAISGKDAKNLLNTFNTYYLPHTIIAAAEYETTLPLLKNRYTKDKSWIYVCQNNSCKLPVTTVKEAIEQIYN